MIIFGKEKERERGMRERERGGVGILFEYLYLSLTLLMDARWGLVRIVAQCAKCLILISLFGW